MGGGCSSVVAALRWRLLFGDGCSLVAAARFNCGCTFASAGCCSSPWQRACDCWRALEGFDELAPVMGHSLITFFCAVIPARLCTLVCGDVWLGPVLRARSGGNYPHCHSSSYKSALREVETVFSPVSLLLLRSTAPPRWRVSSVGERGANIACIMQLGSDSLHDKS